MNNTALAEQPQTMTEIGDGVLPADVSRVALSIVNAYLVGPAGAGDRQWVLIDAGLPTSGGAIARAAAERFGPSSRPSAIVLTHGHFDHVGALRELADRWDAPIYAHRLELPYLTGKSKYPPPDPTVGGGLMSAMSRTFPRSWGDFSDRIHALPAHGSIPGMPGWRRVHTPGHSPGHVSLFRDADRTLIVGDAFVTTRQESASGSLSKAYELNGPPAYFTPDWQAARRSVVELAALHPAVAATGHGQPVAGETLRRGLDVLAQTFERTAVPRHGRYVRDPARADESGVTYTPPAVADPLLPTVAAVGVLGVAAWVLSRNRSA